MAAVGAGLVAPALAFADTAAIVTPGLVTPASAAPSLANDMRSVSFNNLHTGESMEAVYWEQGSYIPDALDAVNHHLRDFRTGDVHPIDPRLLDLLDTLATRTGTRGSFEVISGYRSPQTNAMLHERSDEVAKKSFHLQGMAIDIRLADVDLDRLHDAALSLGGGGVGVYPDSDFVHVDVGPVRNWRGL